MMIELLRKGRIALCRLLEAALILAVAFLVLDVLWGVFTRYALAEQAKWSEELARFLLVWVSLLGAALAFGEKAHLGVDYFVAKFDPAVYRIISLLRHLVVLFFAIAIFIVGGSRVVSVQLSIGQKTPALGWPMGYVYLPLPIAGIFMVLFTIEQFLETWLTNSQVKEAAK
jgi:TRAP-type C4-dicarboxylate transport system permease small subunit